MSLKTPYAVLWVRKGPLKSLLVEPVSTVVKDDQKQPTVDSPHSYLWFTFMPTCILHESVLLSSTHFSMHLQHYLTYTVLVYHKTHHNKHISETEFIYSASQLLASSACFDVSLRSCVSFPHKDIDKWSGYDKREVLLRASC